MDEYIWEDGIQLETAAAFDISPNALVTRMPGNI